MCQSHTSNAKMLEVLRYLYTFSTHFWWANFFLRYTSIKRFWCQLHCKIKAQLQLRSIICANVVTDAKKNLMIPKLEMEQMFLESSFLDLNLSVFSNETLLQKQLLMFLLDAFWGEMCRTACSLQIHEPCRSTDLEARVASHLFHLWRWRTWRLSIFLKLASQRKFQAIFLKKTLHTSNSRVLFLLQFTSFSFHRMPQLFFSTVVESDSRNSQTFLSDPGAHCSFLKPLFFFPT